MRLSAPRPSWCAPSWIPHPSPTRVDACVCLHHVPDGVPRHGPPTPHPPGLMHASVCTMVCPVMDPPTPHPPGLMLASVCTTSLMVCPVMDCISRPKPLTMPAVRVWSRPGGVSQCAGPSRQQQGGGEGGAQHPAATINQTECTAGTGLGRRGRHRQLAQYSNLAEREREIVQPLSKPEGS